MTSPGLIPPTAAADDTPRRESFGDHNQNSLNAGTKLFSRHVKDHDMGGTRGMASWHKEHDIMVARKGERTRTEAGHHFSSPESVHHGNCDEMLSLPPLQIALSDAEQIGGSNSSSELGKSMGDQKKFGGPIFNYHGDSLSPEDSRNLSITPVVEEGRELFYCHFCSFCGTSRDQLKDHLDNHFEHRCDRCDYTSRTEGRLKQHVLKFHRTDPASPEEDKLMMHNSSPDLLLPTSSSDQPGPDHPQQSTPAHRTPGRRKIYRCKQCNFTAVIKNEFWNHARIHIKPERILECPKCAFVTEYKHHLEYHLRNHFGSKPFKCTKCNYSCVNKSMLNSHMKSHTNIYQFRCADCTYATKYCHSLKLHLRKYSHKPASILNLDGTIDHDTSALLTMRKSGPKGGKVKEEKRARSEKQLSPSPMMPHHGPLSHQFPSPVPGMMPFWPTGLSAGMRNAPPPPPLIHSFLTNFMPPRSKPHTITAEEHNRNVALQAMSSPPVPYKCDQCEFGAKSREELHSHVVTSHGGPPSMLSMFRGFGVERSDNFSLPNTPLWPRHANVLGMNVALAAQAAFNMSQFGAHNALPLGGGYSVKREPQMRPISAERTPSRLSVNAVEAEMINARRNSAASDVPLDLTKPNAADDSNSGQSNGRKRSRKGKAFKLEALCQRLQEKMDCGDQESKDSCKKFSGSEQSSIRSQGQESNHYPSPTESMINGEATDNSCSRGSPDESNFIVSKESNQETNNNTITSPRFTPNNGLNKEKNKYSDSGVSASTEIAKLPQVSKERFNCTHCDISFGNCAMYTIHMGYHGYLNPFICNLCGVETADKVGFFCHIARSSHA